MPRPIRALTAALAVLLLVSACGDNGDDAAPTATTAAPTETDGEATADPESDEVPQADPGSELAASCPVDALEGVEGPVPITMWHSMTVELDETLTALVQRYNASQDRVEVRLSFQGGYNDSLDRYLTALRGGTRPTIIQLEETALQLAIDSGAFVPVQACIDAAGYELDDFLERVVSAHTVDGVLHPMPFNTSNPILYANRAMLDQAGIAELPTTLAELRAAAQAVVDAGVAPAGMALTTSPWIIEQWFALADQPVVDGGNGRQERATELLIDDPLGQEIFEWLSAMVVDGLAINVGTTDNLEHFIALATGQAALTIDTSAALRSVLVAAPDFGVEVAVGPMPSVGERTGGVAVGGAALWLDSETSDAERAAAWDFMRWLDEPEQQAEWHAGTGYIPIRRSAIELPAVSELWAAEPEFRLAYDQLVDGPATGATAGPVIGNHAQVREQAIRPALDRLWIQGQDPAAALAEAKAEGDRIIADYTRRVGG
jgi:sn-glycerol 3-phosphate transport system substrate-binding protein